MRSKYILLFVLTKWFFAVDAKDVTIDYQTRVMADICFTCHGAEKMNIPCFGFPPIAGGNVNYLKRKMKEFKTDNNFSIDMHRYAKGYSAKEIDLLVKYISKVGNK